MTHLTRGTALVVCALTVAIGAGGCVHEVAPAELRPAPTVPAPTGPPVSGPPQTTVPAADLPTRPADSPLIGVRWSLTGLDDDTSAALVALGAWFELGTDGTLRFDDGINDGSGPYTLTRTGFVTHDVFSSAVGYGGLDPRPYRVMQAMVELLRESAVEPPTSSSALVIRAGGHRLTFTASGDRPPSPARGAVAAQPDPTLDPRPDRPVCTAAQLRGTQARSGNNGGDTDFAVVTLTNTSARTCSLLGYPFVLARDENHLAVRIQHEQGSLPAVPDPGPRVVELPPGGRAWFAVGTPLFYRRTNVTIGELAVVPGGLDAADGPSVPVTVALPGTADGPDVLLVVTAYAAGEPPVLS